MSRSVSRTLIVVSDPRDLPELPPERLLAADQYLGGDGGAKSPDLTVVNLCRTLRYRTKGYYVSLLGDARGHTVLPSAETIEGLSEPFSVARVLGEASVPTVEVSRFRVRRSPPPSPRHKESAEQPEPEPPSPEAPRPSGLLRTETLVYFGRSQDVRFQAAAQALYREWPVPVLRLHLCQKQGEKGERAEWKVCGVEMPSLARMSPEERAPLIEALTDERFLMRQKAPATGTKRASLAVLHDPTSPFSPSSPETLDRLERVAAKLNVHVDRLGLDEIERVGEFDALFIRALTGVREPSFPFALRAESLDMPVIDDPQSIIRCSNKVFLEELLRRESVATPRTLIATPHTPWSEIEPLGLPLVVKLPDGSFSAGVHKCATAEEYRHYTGAMFRKSPMVIVQEFLPSDFDWRITVLGGRVLFAARYFMARGHWQIRSESKKSGGPARYGRVEAVRRDEAPEEVLTLALQAASLIGQGLYGVDLKETPQGPVVIEVNDNPNLDAGYEDQAEGNRIYEDLIHHFLRQIEETPEAPRSEPDPVPPPAARKVSAAGKRHYRPFEVAGMELEYAAVEAESLEPLSLVEDAFRAIAGRGTSDVTLGGALFSNEIADHVLEIKTPLPTASFREAEAQLAEGVRDFSRLLRERFGARLLPTGMHPWLNPAERRLWSRSNARIYQTYARLFDTRTHGWMNVHASHLNLPMGRETDAIALMNAAALLVPYLPALAASSPMHDGRLQEAVDNRLAWLLLHQAKLPESQGAMVPEFVATLSGYRKEVLQPIYRALDRLPDAGALRHEFMNARAAVFKASRRALEIRVLDTQECVRMDIAIAVFVRSALRYLVEQLGQHRLALPEHSALVLDFHEVVRHGSAARVRAPHLPEIPRDETGKTSVRTVLRSLLLGASRVVRRDEAEYLDLVAPVITRGSLSERIRSHLMPYSHDPTLLREASRVLYTELSGCLERNEPWVGRQDDPHPDRGNSACSL